MPNLTLGRVVRFFWLLGYSLWLHSRLEAAHRHVDQVRTDEAGDALLRAAERWLACHEEIGALLNLPAPPHVEKMRAVLSQEPSRRGMEGRPVPRSRHDEGPEGAN